MVKNILLFALISLVIYLGIASALILSDRPKTAPKSDSEPMAFNALTEVDYEGMPGLEPYTARDGSRLYHRTYESSATADKVLILLHGSGWHSMQFYPLAKAVSQAGLAHVITPDLRGHGFDPQRRGDVDTIGQLEDDLADLIALLEQKYPQAAIIVGGHSSGGGLAVRFAGSSYGSEADAFLLLAPFLKYNAPTTRPNSGGWAQPLNRRIAGLVMLNNIGVRWFNNLTVIQFNFPQAVLTGPLGDSATSAYSYRMNTSFAPRSKYGRDLSAMQQPFLLVAGLADRSFIAEKYETTISDYTDAGTYVLLPDVGHIDLLTTLGTFQAIEDWITSPEIERLTPGPSVETE